MSKIVLGINDQHDAGCALIVDGQIVAAYEEERFSRKKNHNGQSDGLPRMSLSAILKDFEVNPRDIDYVAFNFPRGFYLLKEIYTTLLKDNCKKWWLAGFLNKDFHGILDYIYPFFYVTRKTYRLNRLLKEFGISPKKVRHINHHEAHAASAYYASGLNKALILTLDGHGSGLSGSISVGNGSEIRRKAVVSKYNSVGLLYSTITAGLGFKAGRHEGKILGLAAFGDPKVYYEKFEQMISCEGLDFDFKMMRGYPSPIYPHFISPKKMFRLAIEPWFKGKREDLCAALQKRTEDMILEWVRNAMKEFDCSDIVVAGGVFSNVKVNQRIREMKEVNSLFVFPAMSDSGLSSGAALRVYNNEFNPKTNETSFKHTYLGKDFGEEIETTLKKLDIPYKKDPEIEKTIGKLINESKVVARYNGRTEYGPRALGNRSILYNGRDKEVNLWLNKKLDRTEFMPFAPSLLAEDAHLYFEDVEERFAQPADFMTQTFNCKDKMKVDCPAAVHIDNTARPQFVRKETNPSYHKIISEYKKLSGSSVVVNTSFNVHEEPIVNSPKDAIRSFLFTRIDALALGDFLVLKEDL
jgi:carbamoyltransferase